MILLIVVLLEEAGGERAGELKGVAGFDPDDGMLVVPLLVWLGFSEQLLLAAFVGAPAFAVYVALKFRRQLRGASASGPV